MARAAFGLDRMITGDPLDRLESVLIVALILANNSVFYRHVHAQSVDCKAINLSEMSQHCRIYADGVRDLDCFSKNTDVRYRCTWEPGERTQGTSYTLLVLQKERNSCRVHHDITGSSLSSIRFYTNYNVTVEVYQDIESADCSKAVFGDLPTNIKRCEPPSKATFRRQSGRLEVNNVTWPLAIQATVKQFRLRVLGSQRWNESLTQSESPGKLVLEDLNTTLAYAVQLQCVTSQQCPQCGWSEVYMVPPELTAKPVVISVKETNIGVRSGRRWLTLTWEFPSKQQHKSYVVTVRKASGEGPKEHILTAEPEVTLILSYSAYRLQVSAVNNVSSSPALRHIVWDESGLSVGKLNVTIQSNTSFTIHWEDNLIDKYVCYSAEWRTKGGKTLHMSFFQDRINYRTLSPLPEALEPFTRYSLTLHTRPDKDTCNLKSINNSESTYGTTQFYLTEGTPVGGPENINFTNVTLDSAMLQWSVIPEEDLRGFLLGYKIFYAEYNYKETTTTENNITVGPEVNAYTLRGLKGGTEYEVQISGVTGAGEGVPSRVSLFTATKHQGSSGVPRLVIMAIAFVTVTLIFGTLALERAKALLWPSIPNPRHSNALQKLGRPCELELLGTPNTLKVEEGDTDSLQIVDEGKQEEAAVASAAEALLPQRDDDEEDEEDEDHSEEISTASIQGRPTGNAAAVQPYIPADAFTAGPQVDLHTGALPVVASGYTTLEMFQKATPQGAPGSTQPSKERQQEEHEEEEMKPRCSYIRPLSTNSTEMSTFL